MRSGSNITGKFFRSVAQQASQLERRADEAERETIKMKKVEYMESRIGNEYEGVISGITNYGLYVELPNTVEGMVHVTTSARRLLQLCRKHL